MELHKHIASVSLINHGDQADTLSLWEISACAMALWSRDRSLCLLNESARRLINYAESDFLHCSSLWGDRIHPHDQQEFRRSEEALRNGKSPVRCDYRFLPKNAQNHIWLREASVLSTQHEGTPWHIFSAYTDISDLQAKNAAGITADNMMNSIKLLNHELMNCVQKVVMELELAKLGLDGSDRSSELLNTVDAMNRSVMSLRGHLASLVESLIPHDPSSILDDTLQKLRKQLHRQSVNLRLVRRGPLPLVRGDRDQLLSAFEGVFESCRAMIKNGGNLDVEAGPKEVGGQLYAEVKVISSSAATLDCDDYGTYQGYETGEGYQVGIGIALAAEILSRYRGQVSFRKQDDNRGEVTILIKASPN
jgi:PAS domain-containing protein